LPNGLRYWQVGGAWTLLGSSINLKPEKCSKTATNPTSRVHLRMMAGDHFIREKQGRQRKYTPKRQARKPNKAVESMDI